MPLVSRLKKTAFRLLQGGIDRSTRREALRPGSAVATRATHAGHLIIGGCDCTELAAQYGTPLLVVDRRQLEANYHAFAAGLAGCGLECSILYSYKTNPVPGILRLLHDCGAGAEVISPYELWLALQLGVPPQQIVYNGPAKSSDSLRLAIERGIRLININSLHELALIEQIAAEAGQTVRVGVRITPAAGWGGQFGLRIASGEALAAFKAIASSRWLEAAAIHFHLGTNLKRATCHQTALAEVVALMAQLEQRCDIRIGELDLGGGFGVPRVRALGSREMHWNTTLYKPFRREAANSMPEIGPLLQEVTAAVTDLCRSHRLDPPALLFEPGRAITSSAEILLTRVHDRKATANGFPIALLDAGVNLARPLTFEYHEIVVANKATALPSQRCGLAGPICTPMDFFLKSAALPPLEIGDLLAILDAGAYFTSFANQFSLPRPAIILTAEGNHQILRDAERFADLIARDRMPVAAPPHP